MSLDPSSETSSLLAGDVVAGRYRVLSELGAGAMGRVYVVESAAGAHLALKVLNTSLIASGDTTALGRFVREVRLAATINSRHVVPVTDSGEDQRLGVTFLVMPLMSGSDLATWAARLGAMHPVAATRVVLQAARGLSAAHRAGIIHRDIKPANIFVDQDEHRVLTVRIGDFGIAKAMSGVRDGTLTRTGATLGTPLYMAPEQLEDAKRADERADVWSLGMTLYECLAGASPLGHVRNLAELVIAVTSKPITPLQDLAPWVDPALATVVQGTLIRSVEDRCPCIDGLIHALMPFAGGEDRLTLDQLQPVPRQIRDTTAPRASAVGRWQDAAPSAGPPDLGQQDPNIGHLIAGKYRLIRLLGRGGMGAVYEATAPDNSRCAVKLILPESSKRSRDAQHRFVREAKMAMSIDSAHVVRVIDAGTDAELGTPFLTMELLEGIDLSQLIKKAGPLDPAVVATIFSQACKGLSLAHRLGIIHRDIKPANLFLHQPGDGSVTLKVCDFGVAKHTWAGEADRTDTDLTRTGGMLGSPAYMSPEQAQNAKTVDSRTDVWSLAISMHEALCGQKPWSECETVGQLVLAICTREVTSVQSLAPWVPARLAQAVHAGLVKDPGKRWQTTDELLAAIEEFDRGTLSVAELRGIPAERRQQLASATEPVAAGSGSFGTQSAAPTAVSQSNPNRRTRLGWSAGGVLISVLVAIALWLTFARQSEPAIATVESSSVNVPAVSIPSVIAPTKMKSKVEVRPPDASVAVNGTPRALSGGQLELEGLAGDSFLVVASYAGQRVESRVVMTVDGTPSPTLIEVPKPVAPGSGRTPARTAAASAPKSPAAATPLVPPPTPTRPPTRDNW